MGFYYGVKLQLITDMDGVPLSLQFTTTKIGDRDWLEQQANTIFKDNGYLFVGDKGYQGIEFNNSIQATGNYIFTGIRKSKKVTLPLAQWQLKLLKLRARIETCFGKLKNNYNLVSTKARTPLGYMFNWILAIFSFVVGW